MITEGIDLSVIYADVFIFYNFLIDLFLLYVTGKVMKIPTMPVGLVVSSGAGAIYSFFVIICGNKILGMFPVRLLVLYVMISIGYKVSLITRLKTIGMFFAVSCMFCGVLLGVNVISGGGFAYFEGYPVFLTGHLLLFVCMFIFLFFGVIYIKYAIKKFALKDVYKEVKITFGEKTEVFNALVDTGNNIYDYVNRCPVILINKEKAHFTDCRVHLIDISTVSGTSTVLCITPKRVEIDGKKYRATVGICSERIAGYDALLSANMFVSEGEYV